MQGIETKNEISNWCTFVFRDKKELELSQVRQNIEDSKRLGSEKTIRNKSDLERRVRELKSNNTKKFLEERKRQIMKQEREKDNLTKSHEIQKTTLLDEIDKVRITASFDNKIHNRYEGKIDISKVITE
jgi:hypothetical protein